MSQANKSKTKVNLTVLKEISERLGFRVTEGARVRGWNGRSMVEKADLVVSSDDCEYDVGFTRLKTGEVEIIRDDHDDIVKEKIFSKIIPEYYKDQVQSGHHRQSFAFRNQERQGSKVRLRVGRN